MLPRKFLKTEGRWGRNTYPLSKQSSSNGVYSLPEKRWSFHLYVHSGDKNFKQWKIFPIYKKKALERWLIPNAFLHWVESKANVHLASTPSLGDTVPFWAVHFIERYSTFLTAYTVQKSVSWHFDLRKIWEKCSQRLHKPCMENKL